MKPEDEHEMAQRLERIAMAGKRSQLAKSIEDLAALLRAHYLNLLEQGFTQDQSMKLTSDLQWVMLTRESDDDDEEEEGDS